MHNKPRFNVMCMIPRLLVGMVFALCLVGEGALPAHAIHIDGSPAGISTETPFQQRLRFLLATKLSELRVPGAVVFVQSARAGSWTATFGTSDLATNAPITTDLHFRIGSITKTFVGTVILQLADEGKLQLNDPVSLYYPGVPNGENITIRELLNMSSGLYNYSEDDNFSKILSAEIRGINPNRAWDPLELLSIAFKHKPYFAPGQGFHYSNTNYILLGQIIEQLTGHPARDEIQHRIFDALGMRHSLIPEQKSSSLPTPYSQGYTYETLVQPGQSTSASPINATMINPSWGGTAGDAISTLDDLKIWVKALAKGTLISPKLQKERLQWLPLSPNVPSTLKYGLAIADFYGFIGHNGGLPGYQSFAVYMPEKDASIIVLENLEPSANGTSAADELGRIIAQDLT